MRWYVRVTNPFDGQLFISKLQKLYTNKFQTFSFVQQKCIYTATGRVVHYKTERYTHFPRTPLKPTHLPKCHCSFYSYWFKLVIFLPPNEFSLTPLSLSISLSISISSVSLGIWIKTLRVIECSGMCLLSTVINQGIY